MRKATCRCSRRFQVEIAGNDQYERVHLFLDRNRHPTFIGRNFIRRASTTGGLLIFRFRDEDIAVTVVNTRLSIFLVLCVKKEHRHHGLASAITKFLQCNFVRCIEDFVPFFESLGYIPAGDLKQGKRYRTQVMVYGRLKDLAGRVSRIFSDQSKIQAEKITAARV